MPKYYENTACLDSPRTPKDVLDSLTIAEQKIFYSMTPEEIKYLGEDCDIQEYVEYLRKGKTGEVKGSDYPILVIKGTPLQLTKFEIILLMTLIDYQGVTSFYPSDFSLGDEALEELRQYTGLALIKVEKGSATSEGLDEHRTELITSILATRRDLFNPSVVLMEENIAGKLGNSASTDLLRKIALDKNKLIDKNDTFNANNASRKKIVNKENNYSNRSNNNYNNRPNNYDNSNVTNTDSVATKRTTNGKVKNVLRATPNRGE